VNMAAEFANYPWNTGKPDRAFCRIMALARRPLAMKQNRRSRVNRKKAKTVLRLPDLEYAKAAVLNSLTSIDAQSERRTGCPLRPPLPRSPGRTQSYKG